MNKKFWLLFGVVLLAFFALVISLRDRADQSSAQLQAVLLAERPIAMQPGLWLEELTWMEIRDLIAMGHTTVIVPTGGIEQNGPNVITGKHDKIVEAMSEGIAAGLGNTLLAPVVKFVPEGNFDPPTGHMQYPGTIGLSEDTFRDMLVDICRSLELHGFRNIVLLGDSGGNQSGMAWVAEKLNSRWKDKEVNVIHERDYYFKDLWSYNFLKSRGVFQEPDVQSAQRNDVHSDLHYEALLASIDPDYIRANERRASGRFEINGVQLDPIEKTRAIGKALMAYRIGLSVESISKQLR